MGKMPTITRCGPARKKEGIPPSGEPVNPSRVRFEAEALSHPPAVAHQSSESGWLECQQFMEGEDCGEIHKNETRCETWVGLAWIFHATS